MSIGPIWATTAGFLITATELVATSVSVVANGTDVSYKLISGNLPADMNISSTGTISGIPQSVLQKNNYKFVVRATSSEGVSDRSFNIDVIGEQAPTWSTASGYSSRLDYNTGTAYLKLGPEGTFEPLPKIAIFGDSVSTYGGLILSEGADPTLEASYIVSQVGNILSTVEELYPDYEVVNISRGRMTTAEALGLVPTFVSNPFGSSLTITQWIINNSPDKIVLRYGLADAIVLNDSVTTLNNLQTIIDFAVARGIEVILIGVNPAAPDGDPANAGYFPGAMTSTSENTAIAINNGIIAKATAQGLKYANPRVLTKPANSLPDGVHPYLNFGIDITTEISNQLKPQILEDSQAAFTGKEFTLNKQWVNYQFSATPTNAPASTPIKFFIPENGGELPPGILLNQEGVLSGFLNDILVFDGSESDTGGYDEEAYDGYSYDHGLVAFDSIGVPKIYQFKVTASDGVSSADRFFKILVVSPDMIRDPNRIQMDLEPGLITTNTNYLPPPQFVNGSDLGIARAENNETFDVSAYDGYPLLGNIVYSLSTGDSRLTQLPDFLELDTTQGIIYGYIPYQPAYTQNYQLTINATRNYNGASVVATNTFTLAIRGAVESSIEWVSSSSLGTIFAGEPSELAVVARQVNSEYTIKYSKTSGTIPPGLVLERDGSLSGSVEYNNTGTFVFGVRAKDVHELSAIDREFTLVVDSYNDKKYTKAWVRPFMTLEKRAVFRDFMVNTFTFPQSSMYRYFDPNFGVQTEIKMILEFGIEQQNLADYIPALRENFYRRRFYFGDIKVAVAKTPTGTPIYEVVYVDVVDNMIQTNTGTTLSSVSRTVYSNKEIYYPSSIDNMRYQLEHLTLNDTDFISTNEYNMPVFMRTAQQGSYRPAGYMHVLPLCYVLPGEGQKIISRIKLSGFDFKQFDMDIDRLILDNTLDNSTAKYLLFPRQKITDRIESDEFLYVFDETTLDTDQDVPVNRE